MGIVVYRRGVTSDGMYYRVTSEGKLDIHQGSVTVTFVSGGRRRGTEWSVQINPDVYDALASLMAGLSPKDALRAFKKSIPKAEREISARRSLTSQRVAPKRRPGQAE